MNGGTDGQLFHCVSYYFENCDREMPNRRRSDITRRFDMGYLNNVHHEQTLATIDPDTQASEVLRLERFSWDFAKAPEESRQGIDHYARLYSNAFEPAEILPQGCIKRSSLVCMVSVVEFRGSWKQAFDDRTATRETFYESDGSFTPVVMVHQTGRFRLAKCTELRATAIELPYELPGNRQGTEPSRSSVSTPRSGIVTPACVDAYVGPEFSLVVLLPEEKNGLELLESKLSAFTAMTCFDQLRAQQEVRVSLPLFKVKQLHLVKHIHATSTILVTTDVRNNLLTTVRMEPTGDFRQASSDATAYQAVCAFSFRLLTFWPAHLPLASASQQLVRDGPDYIADFQTSLRCVSALPAASFDQGPLQELEVPGLHRPHGARHYSCLISGKSRATCRLPNGRSHAGHLFFVFNKASGLCSLVDTAAEVSVVPPSPTFSKNRRSTVTLQPTNKTNIMSYGERAVTLNLGLRHLFRWLFFVADAAYPILGAEFLRQFDLPVETAHKRLIDAATHLTVQVVASTAGICTVTNKPPSSVYEHLFDEFLDLLHPSRFLRPVKHDVTHHIITTGPSVHSRPRRIAPG
ncbi:uncharacterized protein [Dermacentor albipictus]|uniref:uncharacterized protein isoform X1 n=1 Tax=Dermacentor albipictus TaxID=60249 RepID=UPI0031FE0D31